MANWKKVVMSEFLTERKGRFKPNHPEIINYKRLDKIDFRGNIHISEKASKTDMILIKPGDLVISGINVSKGALSVYEGKEPICATIHFSSYLFDNNKIDIDFLKRFLKSPSFQLELQNQVKGGIKTEIKPKHLLPLKVRIPDLSEQKKINKYFDSLDNELLELSNENDHQQTLFKKLRQAILQEAIEGKLTTDWRIKNSDVEPASELLKRIAAEKEQLIKEKKIKKQKPLPPISDAKKPFELPKGWEWTRLGDVIELISGQHIEAIVCNDKGLGSPYLTGPADFGAMYPVITKWTKKPKVFAKKDDLLITVKGSGVGKTNICNLSEVAISRQLMGIRSNFLNPALVGCIISSKKDFFQNSKNGLIPGISREHILEILIALPPLAEQEAIVAKVESLLSIVDELESQVNNRKEQAKDLMQAVLREAFEGGKHA